MTNRNDDYNYIEPDYVCRVRDLCKTLQRFEIAHFGRNPHNKPDVVRLFTNLKRYWRNK